MSGLRKSLRKGKMKKESRSMSQPSGLEANSDELKVKKGFTYYLKPWKWKKQKSAAAVITATTTTAVNNHHDDDADGEPRRNSAPTTPTKNEQFELPSKQTANNTEETTKPINEINQPPVIPKQRPPGPALDMSQITRELDARFKPNRSSDHQQNPVMDQQPSRNIRRHLPQGNHHTNHQSSQNQPNNTTNTTQQQSQNLNISSSSTLTKNTTSKIKFAPSGDIHKTYVPNSLPRGGGGGDSLKKKKNGPAPAPPNEGDNGKTNEEDDPAEKFRRDVKRITSHRNRPDYDDSEDEGTIQWKNEAPAAENPSGSSNPDDLAFKIARRDTIARKEEITNLQQKATSRDMQTRKNDIEKALSRRLSQRPSIEELKERNICRIKSEKQEKEDRELIKKELSRRLSQRPNVEVLKKKKILKFEEYVDVYEVPNVERKADKPWTKLTPEDKASIRKELNEYKATEMQVHEKSKHHTRFHRP